MIIHFGTVNSVDRGLDARPHTKKVSRSFVYVGDKCLNRVYHGDGILPLAIAAAASDEKLSIA
jgi:hypothetical protein